MVLALRIDHWIIRRSKEIRWQAMLGRIDFMSKGYEVTDQHHARFAQQQLSRIG